MSKRKTVAICFVNQAISLLFSDLLAARGLKTKILTDISIIPQNVPVVTEPKFFEKLNQANKKLCLLVGNDIKLNSKCICLSRPLLAGKVQSALDKFIGIL